MLYINDTSLPIIGEKGVVGQEHQTFGFGLRYQHSVKGVFMSGSVTRSV